jgi:hypothetical protein
VAVRFDPESRHWVVSDMKGEVIVRFIAAELSREWILRLDVGHRHPPRQKPNGE